MTRPGMSRCRGSGRPPYDDLPLPIPSARLHYRSHLLPHCSGTSSVPQLNLLVVVEVPLGRLLKGTQHVRGRCALPRAAVHMAGVGAERAPHRVRRPPRRLRRARHRVGILDLRPQSRATRARPGAARRRGRGDASCVVTAVADVRDYDAAGEVGSGPRRACLDAGRRGRGQGSFKGAWCV